MVKNILLGCAAVAILTFLCLLDRPEKVTPEIRAREIAGLMRYYEVERGVYSKPASQQ